MLTNLHVKNLALIDEAEVEFGPGLNILTGETGAGKSILIGSINAPSAWAPSGAGLCQHCGGDTPDPACGPAHPPGRGGGG